jgi:hypothetical protein
VSDLGRVCFWKAVPPRVQRAEGERDAEVLVRRLRSRERARAQPRGARVSGKRAGAVVCVRLALSERHSAKLVQPVRACRSHTRVTSARSCASTRARSLAL